MEELTGYWYLREKFFGGYDVYVEVKRFGYPTKHYRKIKAGEEFILDRINYKNKQICIKRN